MKVGVKNYDDKEYINHFKDKADFIEVMSFANNEDLKDTEIVIHCKHQGQGINPADSKKEKENLEELENAIKKADLINAKKIIFHPGFVYDEDCSREQAIKILKKYDDKRILIENLQKKGEKQVLCLTPEETKKVMNEANKQLCFDINHAASVAFQSGLDPYAYLQDFINLKPAHYHIGGHIFPEDITHLTLAETKNLDLKKVIAMLPEDAEVSLEVTQEIKKTEEDLELFRKLWKETH